MASRNLSPTIKAQVRHRAQGLCEYCHAPEQWQYVDFTVDHVLPLSKGGNDSLNNLALACFHCNRRKSNRLVATDPQTGQETSLFNPRQETWAEHFIWSANGTQILGLTALGRATIKTLRLNRERILNLRAADAEVDRHPPEDDPRLEK